MVQHQSLIKDLNRKDLKLYRFSQIVVKGSELSEALYIQVLEGSNGPVIQELTRGEHTADLVLVTARPAQSVFFSPGWTLPVLNSAHGGKQGERERIILIDHRAKKFYDPYGTKFARPLHPVAPHEIRAIMRHKSQHPLDSTQCAPRASRSPS